MTTPRTHSIVFFGLGGVGLLLLLSVASVIYLLFVSQPQSSTLIATPTTVVQPSSDPLVSVVPSKKAEGGSSIKAPAVLPSDPKKGDDKAKVTVIEFGDFQCEQCAAASGILKNLESAYGTAVRFVWKDMPFAAQHQYSEQAAMAARCADEQDKFWEYHDALLEGQASFATQPWATMADSVGLDTSVFNSCLSSAKTQNLVVQGYFVGTALKVSELPTYYVNDHRLDGPQTEADLKAVIDQEMSIK